MTAPLKVRLFSALRKEPDYSNLTGDRLTEFAERGNRAASSGAAWIVTGRPDRDAAIAWQDIALPGRVIPVRVHRPAGTSVTPLPLVVHVHGGGFIGTATQCDWATSHLAARLPAVVVSVDHRLLTEHVPLSAAVDDGWDALGHILGNAAEWGIDPERVAVFGESCGGMIAALSAIRARDTGVHLRAQVLVNPPTDLTPAGFALPSMRAFADTPTLTIERLEMFLRLAVPAGTDPRALSPLHAADLSGLPPALVVVPALDPLADHGRVYVEALKAAGTPAELSEHAKAGHAFLSMPGLVSAAKDARARILAFLAERLAR
ncbi:alpha/beta hydrolase [Phytomonospora endophytica]|uniref:Acetyl esterase n=1 Tax=Phytomonospora endophytica TaxID=714109 RepID=A0A841FVS6_9ACTN|nr:alpha/beta hydrolase [Phytomonospora endophytica]MBB6037642.1 acetyl esterase [Phytomonospora endophytica]GIG67831.1 alpha/beta hydrolase [Phytomonospora endophytica]